MKRCFLILVSVCTALTATAADQGYWAFRPVRNSPPPPVPADVGSPIDRFIAARLAQRGLAMAPSADRRQLARRAWFDLIGLPPLPEEMEAFLADSSPDAWERLIDELLARPQYGERWGRHWLDVVRFGETNGYERDGNKPHAWRYRDYVIRAFNEDKPYDRFVLEQLAGDQLPGFSPDAIVATGFYRLHVWDDEPDSTLQAEYDDLDDIVVTTSGAFLGLTLGCARCHDHKFDPISQKEYYQFLAFLRNINSHGLHHTGGGGRGLGKITRPLASPDAIAAWESNRHSRIEEISRRIETASQEPERARLKHELEQLKSEAPPYPSALAVTEDEGPPKPTRLLIRGQPEAPGDEVEPQFPKVLVGAWHDTRALEGVQDKRTSRRRALAEWIINPRNPLTARVMVNRIWQHHFGRGIVASPNDFGHTGAAPTHPDLLDYLAQEFMRGGWSIKRMHKLIMTSRAYRMSSSAHDPSALNADESNSLFWRQNPRRLEGEILRDSLLAFGGQLNLQMEGPGVFPELVEAVHNTQDSARKGWGQSPRDQQNRRSIYIFVKRALPYPLLEAFDLSTTTFPMARRPITTVAPQALMLLNDEFVHTMARGLQERLQQETGPDLQAQIDRAFQIVLQRSPDADELARSLAFLTAGSQSIGPGDRVQLALFCVALFNLNETVYVD